MLLEENSRAFGLLLSPQASLQLSHLPQFPHQVPGSTRIAVPKGVRQFEFVPKFRAGVSDSLAQILGGIDVGTDVGFSFESA